MAAVPGHATPCSTGCQEVYDRSTGTGIGLISNIDDKLLGATRRHFRTDFDLVVTAQQVRSYKPDPAHFKEAKRRIGAKTKWVHIATGLETDVIPCVKRRSR